MAGLNKVMVIGRLGNDPELRQTGGGQAVCTMNLATSENWTDKEGNRQERTEWHRVVVWGKQGENCAKYLSKGRQAYVEGKLQTRSWETPQGEKKYTTEVVAQMVQFLGDNGNASQGRSNNNNTASSNSNEPDFSQDFAPEPFFDSNEEVPF
ncbi:MAG: single-stranded DNA-binding protein [Bdellovibrionales bacterium]